MHGLFAAVDAMPQWQVLGLVAVVLVLETSAFIGFVTPGESVLMLAAASVASAADFALLAGVAVLASVVGQTGGYLIGRRWGGALRRSRAGRLVKDSYWDAAEGVLRSGRARVLIGSRFVAAAHALVPVLAGTLRMPLRRFAEYTLVGAVVWAVTYVAVGAVASAALRSFAQYLGPVAAALVVVAAVAGVVVHAVRSRRSAGCSRGIPPRGLRGSPDGPGHPRCATLEA